MFWKKKAPKCEHDWYELSTGKEYVDYTTCGIPDSKIEEVSHIYCPRCDTRKRVSGQECKLIIKAQEVKQKYQKEKFNETD